MDDYDSDGDKKNHSENIGAQETELAVASNLDQVISASEESDHGNSNNNVDFDDEVP